MKQLDNNNCYVSTPSMNNYPDSANKLKWIQKEKSTPPCHKSTHLSLLTYVTYVCGNYCFLQRFVQLSTSISQRKMSTNFKYNLNKSLKKYVKYIPQLSKPVLRVLIQGYSNLLI